MKNKEALVGLLISVVTTGLLVGGIEWVCYRLTQWDQSLAKDHFQFRRSKPEAYKNSPYLSDAFIEDHLTQPGGWQYPEGTRLIIPNDYSSEFYHVKDGIRATSFQPDDFKNTIYIFGGSTIFCGEVPDDHTIPSYMQARLNQLSLKTRVVNYGTTTVTSTQQLERLKTIEIDKEDVVIFYDGVNDVTQSVFFASPEETMIERNRRVLQDASWLSRAKLSLYENMKAYSYTVAYFLNPNKVRAPAHLEDEQIQPYLEALGKRFVANQLEAKRWTEARGGQFFHFLQPTLFTRDKLSQYEQELMANPYIVLPGMPKAFQRGYQVLADRRQSIAKTVQTWDLTSALNPKPENEEYFLDYCHVTEGANARIAQLIVERVAEFLPGHKEK